MDGKAIVIEPAAETESTWSGDPVQDARELANSIAAPCADSVDAQARFPVEAMAAIKSARLLSAGITTPPGASCDILVQSSICFELAQACASSAMILAMHYIQLDCLVNHSAGSAQLQDYIATLVKDQRLLASVTSEVGTDGDLRRSIADIQAENGKFQLKKHATTVSYGQYADDFLITARSSRDAAESDQRLVLALAGKTELTTKGAWDTLGMRGTVSPGGTIATHGESWQIIDDPFAEVAALSMVPISHLLWTSCWLGIARSAVNRTRQAVQSKARRDPDSAKFAAMRLAAIHSRLRLLETEHMTLLNYYSDTVNGPEAARLTSIGNIIRFNDIKINVSEGIVGIVQEAIQATGISAYRNNTRYSLGRHLRDSVSASLMINNDRIRASNAEMQLVFKDR